MLQFWKKPGQKEKNSSYISTESYKDCSITFNNDVMKQGQSISSSRSTLLASFEDEGLCDSETEVSKEQSRLSKTLTEVLADKTALPYFVQYLEGRLAVAYVQCWLDIESFQMGVLNCPHLHKENCTYLSPLPSTKVDHDSLSVSTDCDSYTADSNSLCDYSTSTISDHKNHGDTRIPVDNKISCNEPKISVETETEDVKSANDMKSTQCDSEKGDVKMIGDLKSPEKKGGKSRLELNNVCDSNVSDSSCKINCKVDTKIESSDKYSTNKIIQEFINEALNIFKKYIALEAPDTIKCPEEIRKEIIENICNTDKLLSSNCFEKVQKLVFNVLDKDYFEHFVRSDYFSKYQIDILTGGNVVLEDILYNETALFYFMEFLEQENNRPLLEFWLAASNFQQQLNDQKEFFDPIEAQNDAVVLYDKYFSLQAHCPLGFSDKIRFAVEQNICGENGLMIDCFHLPLKIVEQVLENNFLKPFLASQLFYKYLSELINAVQCNGYSNMFERNRYPSSECSSEKSFGTNSTFLAMENPYRKQKKEKKTTDMNIDTRQLYDPDALWKRQKYPKLSFGRITELGKFETDFEPEPDKKTESKLKNVVKKIVNLEEDKHKEEMAWQVAEMIVKDITSVTLADQQCHNS